MIESEKRDQNSGGLRWVVSGAWKDDKFHWAAYLPQGDGLATRVAGKEDTYEQALAKAKLPW